MGSVERIAAAIVGVALATTLVLPGRQTPQIVSNIFTGFSGALKSATGR